jgi:hypothetical protein
MNKRGRKSAAELAVVPVAIEARRPPPPDDLTQAQAQVWRDTVATMPAGWFNRSHAPLLVAYCRHVARAAELEHVLRGTMAPGSDATLEQADRLLKMAERETRAITACARSLRLTLQSQMHPRTAGRATVNDRGGPKPWER